MAVAQGLELAVDAVPGVGLKDGRGLVSGDFQAGQVAVAAKPHGRETQAAQPGFGRVDAGQVLGRNTRAMGQAGEQAGPGRLVPGGQARLPGKRPDVRLADAGGQKRA